MPRPLVSVVFSFRNEAENLPTLVSRLEQVFAGEPVDHELIFVNDASTDDSAAILTRLGASNPAIKLITLSRRFGVAEGVLAGMAVAEGDAVIYMDADLQDPPEVIPAVLAAWRDGADVVHTVRTHRQGESRIKMGLTGLAYRLIRSTSSIDLPVDAGDFKLLSRRAVRHLLSLRESDPYLRGLVRWIGFTQVLVPYVREPRHGGRTHFPFFSRNPWKTFALGMTSFSFAPIYACATIALAGFAISFAGLVAALVLGTMGRPEMFWVGLLSGAGMLWATTLGAVSLVGLYVARAYKDVRGRPPYIVASTAGLDGGERARHDQTLE